MKVGIIGCGFIGHKRAKNLNGCQLIGCADIDSNKTHLFSQQFPGCKAFENWQSLIASDAQIIIVATPHMALAQIALAAIEQDKHVLIEKPAAKHYSELESLIKAAQKHPSLVRVGFNHRYHRALQKAHQMVLAGDIGELMFIRGRYGHGGRLG